MSKAKLKLGEVEVESFEIGDDSGATGTVRANEMVTVDRKTCLGQTGLCTACPPQQCF